MTWGIVINNNYMRRPNHCGSNNLFNMLMTYNMFQYFMNSLFNPRPVRPQVQYSCCMPSVSSIQSMPSIFSLPVQQQVNPYVQDSLMDYHLLGQTIGSATYQNLIESADFKELLKSQSKQSIYSDSSLSEAQDEYDIEDKKTSKRKKVKGKKIIDKNNKYVKIAIAKARKYGVDEKLVVAMIGQESNFINGQTSKKGAQGLMQLMPATAKEYGVTDVNDPEQNIDAGVRYIKKLLDMYNGNVKKALAAYNWGMGNLSKQGLANAPRETRNYIKNICENYEKIEIA